MRCAEGRSAREVLPSSAVDHDTHKRYLDYRETHGYFGRSSPVMTAEQFAQAEISWAELAAKGDRRDDDEEARFVALSRALFKD